MMRGKLFLVPALAACLTAAAQNSLYQPHPTERLYGDVSYYEEETYSLVFIRLRNETQPDTPETVQTLRRATGVTCHEFDEYGLETVMTEYTRRDAAVGTLSADGTASESNGIRRDSPVRTIRYRYDEGQLAGMTVEHDGIADTVRFEVTDRHGSYTMNLPGGKRCNCKFDSNGNMVRYTDADGMVTRYSYDENGHLSRTVTDWAGESTTTVTYDSYEYDENGNWTRRIRNSKADDGTSRPSAIEERRYRQSDF